ncbi:hypothetical protein J437_LFUL003794 [Ladona fulva]|uniref:Uncharacterized protein n=1 Tax=Ladona fulva TaxID=123851 RepID=A0A8K0JY82_LADFU|nr:hypothetical protein J437_LFUL003794 [Ladona fulva]
MDSILSPHTFTEVSLTSPDPEYASPSRDLSPPVAPRRARSLTRRPKEREAFFLTVPRTAASVPSRPQRKSKATEFFTVPRQKVKPPERPARSGYATPGPPRAPRRRRASTPLPPSVPASDDHAFESGEEEGRVRDLTAGEVVSKMRSRPLPPPPRPPRRDRTHSADRSAWEEVVEGHLSLGSDRGPGSMTSGRSLSDAGKPPEEVSIAIQTDPLPYDYCVEERAVEEGAAALQAERQASEWAGRTSPVTWPTPPPTPPPVATRRLSAQRRQQAAARRAQTSSQEAIPTEKPPDLAELRSRVTEGILGSGTALTPPSSPGTERRVPPSPPPVSSEEVTSSEIPSPDTPPSIPPLPTSIPPRDIATPAGEVEVPPPPAPTPTPAAPADSVAPSETTDPETVAEPIPPKTKEPPPTEPPPQEECPKEAPPTPKAVHVPPEEPPVPPKSQVTMPPIAPPRPPKPTPMRPPPRAQKTEPTPVDTTQTQSVPPPSFAQLRSPDQPPIYPYYPYSIPPPSSFHQSPPSEETTGHTMPQVPPLGAVAMLCVGEISARKLVVTEFQGPWGPQQSPDPPPEPRRSTTRTEHVHRRRTPSLPTTRRRSMRRRYSEGGGKEMKEGKEEVEDPEDEVPGIGELSGRLARACGNVAVNSVRQLLLTAVERVEGDGRTETAIVIALVMAVALVLLTMGHGRQGSRWEFYLPPPN